MKFDLFSAMAIMRRRFGDDSEILLRNDSYGITTRLTVFRNGEFYHTSFSATFGEITDAYIDVMTLKFNNCLDELKDSLPEENIKLRHPVREKEVKPNHETYARQTEDSNMIFNQITHGDFPTWELAQQAIVTIYVPDMTISRAGISHALKRLEKHYQKGD